jgi:hypothetical protein
MSAFSFIETSFFISLGITFVLILLLVYHFKQRLSIAEGKQDNMFEIINNLAQELTNVKGAVLSYVRPSTPYPHNAISPHDASLLSDNIRAARVAAAAELNKVEEEDEEEEDEEEDEEDSNSESNSDSDYDSDCDSDSEHEKILVSDEDDMNVNVETIISNDVSKLNIVSSDDIHIDSSEVSLPIQSGTSSLPNYSKMNLGALKAFVVEKGWAVDATKMKKAQLIEIIETHSISSNASTEVN